MKPSHDDILRRLATGLLALAVIGAVCGGVWFVHWQIASAPVPQAILVDPAQERHNQAVRLGDAAADLAMASLPTERAVPVPAAAIADTGASHETVTPPSIAILPATPPTRSPPVRLFATVPPPSWSSGSLNGAGLPPLGAAAQVLLPAVGVVPRFATLKSPNNSLVTAESPASGTRDPLKNPVPVFINIAPIAPWYAPADSNAPPRDLGAWDEPEPSQGGQALPPEPVKFALAAGDARLSGCLARWEKAHRGDHALVVDADREIAAALKVSPLTAPDLCKLQSAVAFLSVNNGQGLDAAAVLLCRRILQVAPAEIAAAGEAGRHRALDAVEQIYKTLMTAGDDASLESEYSILSRERPLGDRATRRSRFLRIEFLWRLGRDAEAAEEANLILAQAAAAQDLSRADWEEMNYTVGCAQHSIGQDAVAYASFAAVPFTGDYMSRLAAVGRFSIDLQTGRFSAASDIVEQFKAIAPDAPETAAHLADELKAVQTKGVQ